MARSRPVRLCWLAGALLVSVARVSCEGAGGGTTRAPYPAPDVEKDGDVVVQIGDVTFTTKELEKRIAQQSPFVRQQLRDLEQRRKFVENEIRVEILAQEAWNRGLYKDPRIIAELKRAMVQRVMRDEMEALSATITVSEEDLRDAYRKKEAEFNKPEMIRISQIVRYADAGKAAARKTERGRLEALREEILRKEKQNDTLAFSDAARKHSEDEATKRGGGDLQFLTREELAARYGFDVAQHMFEKAEVGDLLVAEAPNAILLFKKTGRRRGVTRTLEMVKPQLRGQLLGEKRSRAFDAFVGNLKRKGNVSIDAQAIENLKVDLAAPTEPTTPPKEAQPEHEGQE